MNMDIRPLLNVSTHSRPEAAGAHRVRFRGHRAVSTHSRPEAAGRRPVKAPFTLRLFQLTAARRRLAT